MAKKRAWKDLKELLELHLNKWNENAPENLKEIGKNIFFYGTVGEVESQLKNILKIFHPDMIGHKVSKLDNKKELEQLSNLITQILNEMRELTDEDKARLGINSDYKIVNTLYKTTKEEYEKENDNSNSAKSKKKSSAESTSKSSKNVDEDVTPDYLEFSTGTLRKFVDRNNNHMQFERKVYVYFYR